MIQYERGGTMNKTSFCLPDCLSQCYNYKQKAEYIDTLCRNKVSKWESLYAYISPFVAIAEYEEYYEDDILNMSKNKIAAIFEMVIRSYAMYSNYCSVFKDYFSFYGKQFDNVRPNFEDLDIIGNMENRFIKDYSSLTKLLNKAFPLNDNSLDEFRRLAITLAFLGFKKSEIREIKKSEVNFINNTISCGNHQVENVPDNCMSLCERCIDMTEVYLGNTSHLPYNKRTFMPLCDNDFLIRSRYKKSDSQYQQIPIQWFNRAMVSLNKAVSGNYSIDNIRASGLYAWLYERELSGDFNPNQPRRILEKYYENFFKVKSTGENLTKNYSIWKQIFYGY